MRPLVRASSLARLALVPCPRSRRTLADDLVRVLVVAQAEEARLAQATVGRPLGEANLTDELRPRPVCAARDRSRVDERRLGRLERAYPCTEVAQRRRAVAGADLPGVTEPAVLVVADEQRTEVSAAARGLGEAADDELLLPGALQLQPILRATLAIRRIRTLGDEPLPAGPASLGEPSLGVAAPRLDELQRPLDRIASVSRARR